MAERGDLSSRHSSRSRLAPPPQPSCLHFRTQTIAIRRNKVSPNEKSNHQIHIWSYPGEGGGRPPDYPSWHSSVLGGRTATQKNIFRELRGIRVNSYLVPFSCRLRSLLRLLSTSVPALHSSLFPRFFAHQTVDYRGFLHFIDF